MNCEDVGTLFSEYYDGEGSTDEVLAHLQQCPACAAEYEKYAEFMDQVKALPTPELPIGFHAALMRRINSQKRRKSFRRYLPLATAAAASLLVLWIGGAFAGWNNWDDRDYSGMMWPASQFYRVADKAAELVPMAAAGGAIAEDEMPLYYGEQFQMRAAPEEFWAVDNTFEFAEEAEFEVWGDVAPGMPVGAPAPAPAMPNVEFDFALEPEISEFRAAGQQETDISIRALYGFAIDADDSQSSRPWTFFAGWMVAIWLAAICIVIFIKRREG